MGNMKRVCQMSWIQNIMAFHEFWKFNERPPRDRENTEDKNPKREASKVPLNQSKLHFHYLRFMSTIWGDRLKLCTHSLG